jgi:hypothetical protein
MNSHILCGSSHPSSSSDPLTLFILSSSHNRSFSQNPFRCCESSAISSHSDGVNLEIYLETVMGHVWRSTWRRKLSELRETLRGHKEATSEAMMVRTVMEWSSKLGDALAGHDRVNSEMHLAAVIEQVWRCTGRPWFSKFGDALGGRDRATLEIHSEAIIDRDWRNTRS